MDVNVTCAVGAFGGVTRPLQLGEVECKRGQTVDVKMSRFLPLPPPFFIPLLFKDVSLYSEQDSF